MAKPDWGALQHQFLAEHAKSGISPKDWCEAQGLNYASAKRYIKIANSAANSQKKTANQTANSQKGKMRNSAQEKACKGKDKTANKSENSVNSPETKPIRGSRRSPPTNPFKPGNQQALKHGGYGRRMLLSDAITEDAQALTLDDELFWLRAANLTAAENIGRWQAELELANDEKVKDLHELISSAEKAMHRNTQRIESLEYTKGSIEKLRVDAAYRERATEKVEMEIGIMKDGDSDNAIVVHNTLPIPGR
ncbi:TPA: hypothetical protein P1235_001019 [Salmonella enterica subsp. enterica serovar Chester]|nr:hypothetical protein [Salmonella enterica]EBS4038786.1 hypothetical protein [Salmonella enterica subsp. enterica serovar Poona]ECD0768865.1 hypothetical protein [Salmonella enterica subsp. enterica serovar Papuana]ECI8010539.1 hypothetical protein [Salmonella enterica subsp. enterica]EDU1945895.1 hypothetical protein [Salmonella enterica subsp. enterica serovar Saintpaul]EDW7927628.1 hypothetical protein [Salmonella enterica subsp. enterica serovar Oslo]HDN5110968.1 hypothetical protein [S